MRKFMVIVLRLSKFESRGLETELLSSLAKRQAINLTAAHLPG